MNLPVNRLNQLATEINQIWKNNIFEIGRRLIEAKELLPHGQFIPWIERECPFNRRQATHYMVAERRKEELLEPPNSLRHAIKQLESIDQMGNALPISTQVQEGNRSGIRFLGDTPELDSKFNTELRRVEARIFRAAKEKMKEFGIRSGVMNMHIRKFLTIEEPVGRDLNEAINSINKFESREDLDQLVEMQGLCAQLSVRAAEIAERLKKALSQKEKTI